MQIDVRPENVHEMKRPWASTIFTIRVHVSTTTWYYVVVVLL